MAEITISAVQRDFKTKGERNQSRRDGKIPGVMYANGTEPVSILINASEINPLVYTNENHIVYLTIDNQDAIRCILKDVQFHPVTDKIIHFDFMGLTVGQAIEMEIPIRFIGTAKGEREGGVVTHMLHKLHVSSLPKDLPEVIEISVKDIELEGTIFVRDLKFENFKILNDEDTLIVACHAPRESDLTTDKPTFAEPEVITKGKKDKEV